MKIYNAIKQASKVLKKKNIKSSDLDSEILLAKALNKQKEYLIINFDKHVSDLVDQYDPQKNKVEE